MAHQHNTNPQFSKETTQFLGAERVAGAAELLKGKNLSLRAQQEVQHSMQVGSSSWVECVNSGTASCQTGPKQDSSHIKVPKPSSKQQQPRSPPPFRPTIRTQQQIQAQVTLSHSCDRYKGGPPGMDRQAEKDRLAAVFTFGREGVTAMHNAAAACRSSNAAQPKAKSDSTREQLIDQVVIEVTERTQFLEQMKGLLSVEQESSIKAELAQRLKELKLMGLGGSPGGREL